MPDTVASFYFTISLGEECQNLWAIYSVYVENRLNEPMPVTVKLETNSIFNKITGKKNKMNKLIMGIQKFPCIPKTKNLLLCLDSMLEKKGVAVSEIIGLKYKNLKS